MTNVLSRFIIFIEIVIVNKIEPKRFYCSFSKYPALMLKVRTSIETLKQIEEGRTKKHNRFK